MLERIRTDNARKAVFCVCKLMLLVWLFLLQAACGSGGGAAAVTAESVSITVTPEKKIGIFNDLILGSNVNWINNGDGLFDPATGAVRAEAFDLISGMGIKLLRFPGGTLSESFDWKKSIGPNGERGESPDYDGKPQKIIIGIDEFLRFCESANIKPVITVGYSNNTATSAAELVEYCNGPTSSVWGGVRANNGHPEPYKVRFWEIGNEVYNKELSYEKALEYGKKLNEMAVMMKKVDPNIEIGAVGLGCNNTWDEAVLSECAQNIDFMIYHRYLPNASSNDVEDTNKAVIAATSKMAKELRNLQTIASKYNSKLKVVVTEYNLDFRDATNNFINKQSDLQQGLYVAECLRLFLLNGVYFANKWDLANASSHFFSDINFNRGNKTTLSPSYYVQQIFAQSGIYHITETQTSSPTINVQKYGEIINMNNCPVVTALAGSDITGESLSVIIINRELNQNLKANLYINNFKVSDTIKYTEMRGAQQGSQTDWVIEKKKLQKPNSQNSFGLNIPASSIILLSMKAQQ